MNFKKFFFFFFPIIIFSSCENENSIYELPVNARELIAGDSIKTWKILKRTNDETRMNMGPCFMNYRQSFTAKGDFFDNNSESQNCGPSLIGNWKIEKNKAGSSYIKLSSPQISEVMNTEENYKYFKILKVSKDTLILSFPHKQFGNKIRTIEDILVREDLDVGDRYFHH